MRVLRVSVDRVTGKCSETPPLEPGDYFTVDHGDVQVPEGGYLCIWALQNLMPTIAQQQKLLSQEKDDNRSGTPQYIQCPDIAERVVFRVERAEIDDEESGDTAKEPASPKINTDREVELCDKYGAKSLQVEVVSIGERCKSRMKAGSRFTLHGSRFYIPAGCHACIYALCAVLPFMPPKQRPLEDRDWMKADFKLACPDPEGNTMLRITRLG